MQNNSRGICMKYNYVVFATTTNLYRYMYQEMLQLNNVAVYWDKEDLLELLPIMERKIANIYLGKKLNKIFHMPKKKLWYFRAAKRIGFSNENPICFIWHNHYWTEIENGMVEYLKKKFPDSAHIYFFTDPWSVNKEKIDFLKSKMDIVSVFDPSIAVKCGITYFPNVYPSVDAEYEAEPEYDICFVGQDKGREQELYEIARLCEEKGLKTAFYIGRKMGERKPGIRYIENKLPYKEVVNIVKRSKCVLELKVEPDCTCSLRVQEAVVFNKKLLTNNRNVSLMPCCDNVSGISYFEKPEEIDWKFLCDDKNVDYHYDGEYSAQKWFEAVEKELDKIVYKTE